MAIGMVSLTNSVVGKELGVAASHLVGGFGSNPGQANHVTVITAIAALYLLMILMAFAIIRATRLIERLPEKLPGAGLIQLHILLYVGSVMLLTGGFMGGNYLPPGFLAPAAALGQMFLLVGMVQALLSAGPSPAKVVAANDDQHF